jgi:single-stranded-DNA-specific exonuclease
MRKNGCNIEASGHCAALYIAHTVRTPILPVQARVAPPQALAALIEAGLDPELAKIYAARGIEQIGQVTSKMRSLLHWSRLKGAQEFAVRMADAIAAGERVVVVADYDSDGATSCAIAVSALKKMGADVQFAVPNRFVHGYGLTAPVVRWVVEEMSPKIIITVDNGISSFDGVELANQLGLEVLVTDHHLAGAAIPPARVIVNPNQPGCEFPSKSMAGCGVIFYAIAALKDELSRRGKLPEGFNINEYLDLVALGTVADVVKLDENNRMLARLGLARIRQGKARPGIQALFSIANRSINRATTKDFGFSIAPRINAAGRLDDMSIGIQCLLSDDYAKAVELALRLDELNAARKSIESDMHEEALADLVGQDEEGRFSRSVFHEEFHEGVIGIVAGRIKERCHRPTIVFANGQEEGLIKGSARSIPGFNIRDGVDVVHKRNPGLIAKFGGHAMAAGLTIRKDGFEQFREAFEQVCAESLTENELARFVLVDDELPARLMGVDTAELLEEEIWGQGFPEPLFCSEVAVVSQRLLNGGHLKMVVEREGFQFEAIWFFRDTPMQSERIRLVYSIATNSFNRQVSLQLMVQQAEEIGAQAPAAAA